MGTITIIGQKQVLNSAAEVLTSVIALECGPPAATNGRRRVVLLRHYSYVPNTIALKVGHKFRLQDSQPVTDLCGDQDGSCTSGLRWHFTEEKQVCRRMWGLSHFVVERNIF
jgi:hypothetical protein